MTTNRRANAHALEVEITPADTSGSGWCRTAIFTGQVP
ncbi:hypothetical protein QFZ63_001757 [Streptomyces sp. B3I7]|nr:hypothetical protein [Streptomyces sp. B3I7]